ncbi:MAG: C-GCAxxG-C-C family protein [Candidatus Cellulosilyticum pullistercoris]|uniref:C-GCAxxG-C-C family protein n=1 Tax=Candidatus Cellulosilyticum pullistercoris TaxID=2838521 RepID=A0A9E2NKK1_9FIRM|nr:C-GCAxxG-C-C family protein [Candidatus Cellulosilyticum pullistercoris]
MTKVEEALGLFKEGFSCSQAVFAAYAKDLGMDYEMALKVSQAFGGGMGGMRGECGAVTGAYMVISLMYGRTKAEDGKARLKTFNLVKEFAKRFKEIHQTTVCRQLLEGKSGTHYDMCSEYVKNACLLLDELLEVKEIEN